MFRADEQLGEHERHIRTFKLAFSLDPPSSILNFFHGSVPIVENTKLARQTYRIRLRCPELARAIRPGQFIMIRMPRGSDPLLGRPFALYDTVLDNSGQPVGLDVVYLV